MALSFILLAMKKEILHIVVGAGHARYFSNAIESILSNRAGDVFAVYNIMSAQDSREIAAERKRLNKQVVKLIVQPNAPGRRTGSLYDANNLGLEYAIGKYRFASFVQADMQLMWWDDVILDATENFLSNTSCPEVSFYTQLPVLGKHPEPYRRWTSNSGEIWPSVRGQVDVCLMPISESFNSGFSFSGDEKELSERRSIAGARVFLHPFPFLAPIPFPETVRDRKVRPPIPTDGTVPLLKLNPEFHLDFSQKQLHPVCMETSILPARGSIGFPYWPSDTIGTKWIRSRLRYAKRFGGSLFGTIDSQGRRRAISIGRSLPGPFSVLRSLMMLCFEELKRLLSRFRLRRHV